MADAEIRFRATLQDDASRGIDNLDAKVQASGQKAVNANKAIGTSAARAATDSGTAATRIGRAYQSVEAGAKRAAGAIASSSAPLARFVDGFKSASAAASTFSGKMGTLGGTARRATDAIGRGFGNVKNVVGSAFNGVAERAGAAFQGIKGHVDKVKNDVNAKLSDIGRTAVQGLTVALAGLGVGIGVAIKEAASYEQSVGAINAIFKGGSAQMFQFAADAAQTMGLSRNEYQELATVLGASLKNGGVALDELGGKTNGLLQTGADLASMFGGTTKDAVSALTATLRGEYDPIERYGISLRAASVEAKAVEMGLIGAGDEMTNSAKQAATLALIMEQTKDAQGNFARETGTLSGATQILKANWENFYTHMAGYLVPMLANLVDWLNVKVMPAVESLGNAWGAFIAHIQRGDEADWGVLQGFDLTMANIGTALHNAGRAAADMWNSARPFFDFVVRHKDVFGTLALGIGIAATAMGVLTAATWLLNAALVIAFSPVVIIGLFIGALILAYNKVGWFKDWVNDTWATIKVGAEAVGTAIKWVWDFVVTTGQAAWRNLTTNIGAAVAGVRAAWQGITGFFSGLWNGISNTATVAWAGIRAGWEMLSGAARTVWGGIRAVVGGVVDWFVNTGRAAWDGAVRAVGAVMTWLRDNIVTPVWNGIRLAVAIAIGAAMTVMELWGVFVRNILGPAFTWLRDNVIIPVWTAIRVAISAAWSFIRDSVFNPVVSFIRGTFTAAWNTLRTLVQTTWTVIRTIISTAWNFIRDSVFNPAISFIRGAFTAAWNYIRDTINQRWQFIRTVSSQAWSFLKDQVLQPAINFIRGAFTAAWNWIKDTISQRWNQIRTASSQAWAFLRDSVIQPIINFIRGAFTAAWNWIRDTISQRWNAIRTASSQAWSFLRDQVLQPVVNFIRTPLVNAWNWIRDTVTNVWNNIRDRSSNTWRTIRDNTLEPFRRFIRDTIPNAFTGARDAIGRAWDGIKSRVLNPINDVIGFIKNRLIGNINNVLREFRMPTINIGFTSVGGGFKDGGYTGPGNPNQAAGIVHRDEQVIRSASRRSIEDVFPGLLDEMNRKGAAALGAAAPGAAVYGGARSFTGGLTQAVFNAGRLNVSGSAPGYDLAGAIRMVDNATKVKVAAGSGSPNVRVTAGNYADWWAGYFDGGGIRLNNRIAGGMAAPSKRILVAHEIGHALGLPHSDPSGLRSMMSYANMYQHNSVTSEDVKALSAIYGGTGFASGGGGIDIIGILMKGLDAALNAILSAYNTPGGRMAVGAGRFLLGKAKDWVTGKVGGANRGFILPGYSPGTDQTPIMASRGEAVLVPQLVKALGAGNIQAANLTATGSRAGGPEAAINMLTARRRGEGGGGITIQVNLDVTIEGNADMDAITKLEEELEPMLYRIIESNARRGY